MKLWKKDNFTIFLLSDNRCKCLYAINKDGSLCAWVDFDGFSYNKTLIISGVYVLETYRNQGLLKILTDILEELYLQYYNHFSITIEIMNPRIKLYIERLKRMSRFNNAEWIIDESKVSKPYIMSGALFVFNYLTLEKINFLERRGII